MSREPSAGKKQGEEKRKETLEILLKESIEMWRRGFRFQDYLMDEEGVLSIDANLEIAEILHGFVELNDPEWRKGWEIQKLVEKQWKESCGL